MYIKKPSYGSDPLRKIASFGSRRSDDADSYNEPVRDDRDRRRRSHRSTSVTDDYDEQPPRRSRSVGKTKSISRRDRGDRERSDRERSDRSDRDRSDRGDRGDRGDRTDRGDRERRREHRDRSERSHRDRDSRGEDEHRSHRESRGSSGRTSRSKAGSTSGPSSSSRSKAVAPAATKKPKVVVPTGISFRPGRIQSLTADEEVTYKQIWAIFLKSWGYDLNISVADIKYKDCFIASSTSVANTDSNGLSRTATRTSLQSATSGKTASSKKKKGGFFGGGAAVEEVLRAPADSPRMRDIQTKSSSEKFVPCDVPSENVINVFVNHFKLNFENDKDYVSDDDDFDDNSDVNSMESFFTASTTLTNPDDFPTPSYSKSSNGRAATSANSMFHRTAPIKPVNQANVNADLSRISPRDFHVAVLKAARNDLPDNFVLRFVRARKWNTDNALKMLSNSILWRKDFPADDWVFESDGPSYLHGKNQGLIKNFTAEKSWIRGEDNDNNPIFWFLAKKHFGSDSPSNETQRYAVLIIEWCRLFLREVNQSKDTVSIVFDLTGFTLKNADYTTIKFLAEVFEAHYPECLGRIYIHNAPWIFSTVWNIIKNWLDPVVASKIVFTKNFKELSGYVNPDYIPVELGGIDTSGPEYAIPQPGDDKPPKKKDATYRRLKKERDDILMRFMDTTIKWVESTNPEISSLYFHEKIACNIELSNNYIQLDQYVRNCGPYDRNGLLHIAN